MHAEILYASAAEGALLRRWVCATVLYGLLNKGQL